LPKTIIEEIVSQNYTFIKILTKHDIISHAPIAEIG